jgi:hypothetical protein
MNGPDMMNPGANHVWALTTVGQDLKIDCLPVPPFLSTGSVLLQQFYYKTSLYGYTPLHILCNCEQHF